MPRAGLPERRPWPRPLPSWVLRPLGNANPMPFLRPWPCARRKRARLAPTHPCRRVVGIARVNALAGWLQVGLDQDRRDPAKIATLRTGGSAASRREPPCPQEQNPLGRARVPPAGTLVWIVRVRP